MDLSRLNPFAISGLLVILTHLPLWILTISNGKTKVAQIYSLHIAVVILWGFGSFIIGSCGTISNYLIIWKLAYAPVIFIPITSYHSVLLLTKKSSRFILPLFYAQGILFLVLTQLGLLFSSPKLIHHQLCYPQGNNLFLISFLFWILIVFLAHSKVLAYYKETFPEEKQQIICFIIGMLCGFIGGATNFLPGLGAKFYPYGNFLIPLNSIAMTYAIFKHQLLKISISVKKSLVYSSLITAISLLYLTIVITLERILQIFFGYQSILISIFTAFIVGLVFIPLHNKIQNFIDKYFFHGSQEEMLRENELLKEEIIRTEKLKSIGVFASGIAHEIRNPLTAVRTFTEHLPQKLEDKEFLKKFSKIVGHEVERIDGLVHELLEFAKPSPLNLKDIHILSLVDNTVDFLNSHFLKYNINVIRSYDINQDIVVNADINRLRQAFLNIFLNAIEAMEAGGQIKISLKQKKGEKVNIIIEDNGSGISSKDIKHIFDPFYTTKDHGTGLGLSITQRIIQDHNGKIFVESKPSEGTKFTIELPAKENI